MAARPYPGRAPAPGPDLPQGHKGLQSVHQGLSARLQAPSGICRSVLFCLQVFTGKT